MPTATSTLTKPIYPSRVPLKATAIASNISTTAHTTKIPSPPSQKPALETLRTLYNRAARAFLHRDIQQTSSLLDSAFSILHPPRDPLDALVDYRRKWDVLRVTLECTVFTSPLKTYDPLPERLQALLAETPQNFITNVYSRSLALFTPQGLEVRQPNAAYLPSQVLITLVYSSLKMECADVGRTIVEDWLARRDGSLVTLGPQTASDGQSDGYEKILEIYCLQILPKLGQWDYAEEFLDYESELPKDSREHLKSSLRSLQEQASKPSTSTLPAQRLTPQQSRAYSPAPSSSSSSSSLSTTSTHTIVPTSRVSRPSSLTRRDSSPKSHSSSASTTTPRARITRPTSFASPPEPHTSSSTSSSLLRAHAQSTVIRTDRTPSTYELFKAALAPYLTTSRLTTAFILFILFPLISLTLRLRHRNRLRLSGKNSIPGPGITLTAAHGSSVATTNAELVRRRLHAAGSSTGGSETIGNAFVRAWQDIARVVGDTVKMAGSGLV